MVSGLPLLSADRAATAAVDSESLEPRGMAAYQVVCALLRSDRPEHAEHLAVRMAEVIQREALLAGMLGQDGNFAWMALGPPRIRRRGVGRPGRCVAGVGCGRVGALRYISIWRGRKCNASGTLTRCYISWRSSEWHPRCCATT